MVYATLSCEPQRRNRNVVSLMIHILKHTISQGFDNISAQKNVNVCEVSSRLFRRQRRILLAVNYITVSGVDHFTAIAENSITFSSDFFSVQFPIEISANYNISQWYGYGGC